jgi:glycosyltransferase involved in cell wall biosynthesis
MIQIKANAREKPVIGIKAMGMLDTMMHGHNAFLASVAQEVRMRETTVGDESGYEAGHRVVFKRPRTVDYRASVHDIANYLMDLMQSAELRRRMGEAGRERAVQRYDYRVIAKAFTEAVSERLGVS